MFKILHSGLPPQAGRSLLVRPFRLGLSTAAEIGSFLVCGFIVCFRPRQVKHHLRTLLQLPSRAVQSNSQLPRHLHHPQVGGPRGTDVLFKQRWFLSSSTEQSKLILQFIWASFLSPSGFWERAVSVVKYLWSWSYFAWFWRHKRADRVNECQSHFSR